MADCQSVQSPEIEMPQMLNGVDVECALGYMPRHSPLFVRERGMRGGDHFGRCVESVGACKDRWRAFVIKGGDRALVRPQAAGHCFRRHPDRAQPRATEPGKACGHVRRFAARVLQGNPTGLLCRMVRRCLHMRPRTHLTQKHTETQTHTVACNCEGTAA